MNAAVGMEVDEIRRRLAEITSQLKALDADPTERQDLLDEENQLQIRLSKLGDIAARDDSGEAEERAADQSDLTRSPRLPKEEAR